MPKRVQSSIVLLLMALALALALGGCTSVPAPTPVSSVPTVPVGTPTPAVAPVTYTVQRGEVREALQLKGRVAAALDQDVFAAAAGYLRTLHVKRSDHVTSGQLLAEIDSGTVSKQLEQAQIDLRALERATLSTQRQRSLAVEAARFQLQNAEDNLTRLKMPPSPEKLAVAQAKVDKARSMSESSSNALSAAKTNAQFAVERAANGLRSTQDAYSQIVWANGNRPLEELDVPARTRQEAARRAVDDAQRAMESAQITYDLAVTNERSAIELSQREVQLAQQEYDLLLAPVNSFDLRTAERAVSTARINLQTVMAGLDDPTARSRTEQLKAAITELQAEVDKAKVYAPFDGVVAGIGVQVGDKVAAYDALMNVIDPTRLVIVVADIGAQDLARIAPSQPVMITLGQAPDATLLGRVERIPSTQGSPSSMVRNDPLLRISFDPAGRTLNIGDVADLTIVFRNEPNALWIPPAALFTFDQRTFVVLQDGAQQRHVDVTVGIRSAERVQILSGIQAGDIVVGATDLPTPSP